MDKKRYITLLNVMSAISVVFLHTNSCFWTFSNTQRYWATANIIESVFYFAVPIFFMITGATLMDYQSKYNTKEYFKKRINKTVVPFLFWSLIGLIFRLFLMKNIAVSDISWVYILNGILGANIVGIYWFFPALFTVYIFLPVFASIPYKDRKGLFIGLVIAWFIMNSVIPFINNIFLLGIQMPNVVNIGNSYIFFSLIGYLIDQYNISHCKERVYIYFLALLGLGMHIVGTYVMSIRAGEIIQIYKGYLNVPSIFYSVGVFVFVKQIAEKIKSIYFWKVMNILSGYTFSLYLMHWYVIQILVRAFRIHTTAIIWRVGSPFLIIVICIILTWFIRKIPCIRCIVP